MKIPSRAERIAAFRAIFPLLPLFEPRPVLYSKSKTPVAPLVLGTVSVAGNVDFSSEVARELGIRDESFVDDQQEIGDGRAPEGVLELEDLVPDVSKKLILTNADYSKRFFEREDPKALVWMLGLPVLDPTKSIARLVAQLQSTGGSEDWIALAKRTGTKWKLERWVVDA